MAKIQFHPEAAANFNRKGEDLLSAVQIVPPEVLSQKREGFQPDVSVAHSFTEQDIVGPLRLEEVDPYTLKTSAVIFDTGQGAVGLFDDACKRLDQLAENIRKTLQLRNIVGHSFVRKTILDWIEQRVRKETEAPLTSFLTSRASEVVANYEVWIPIANLYLQSEIYVGSVRFRTITREVLDSWFVQVAQAASGEKRAELAERFQQKRQQLQGLGAATVTLEAEAQHAVKVALDEAGRATALLCIFHPANLTPFSVCYCRPLGRENLESSEAYLIKGGFLSSRLVSAVGPPPDPWRLGQSELTWLKSIGLDSLNDLLSCQAKSEFQETLLDSLLLYTKNNIVKEPIEKLIFILVALESMLLKSETEAVQQNIGERLAFIIGSSATERQSVAKIVTECYGFRSRFLHHGQDMKDLETFVTFMKYAWEFFRRLMQDHRQFSSKMEMIEAIEKRKFS